MEVFTPNGATAMNEFFIGSNAAAETGPSYISAADCGIPTPTTTCGDRLPEHAHRVERQWQLSRGTDSDRHHPANTNSDPDPEPNALYLDCRYGGAGSALGYTGCNGRH